MRLDEAEETPMKMLVDAEKCTGCRICELSCSYTKLKRYDPKTACIKVVNLDYWGFSDPVVCIQCTNPACVKACPTQALTQTDEGIILLDEAECDSCGDCVPACPIGAINWFQERGLPMICDLCSGKPACVEWCPTGALTLPESTTNGKKKGKGKNELKYSVRRGKRTLSKLNVPEDVSRWYDKFIE